MARKATPKKSESQKKLERRYYEYRRRAERKIAEWDIKGYNIPKSLLLPSVPKKITEQSIKRLQKITSRGSTSKVKRATAEYKRRAEKHEKRVKKLVEEYEPYSHDFIGSAEYNAIFGDVEADERIQPIESKNNATLQIIESVLSKIKDLIKDYSSYDPYSVFAYLRGTFAAYKTNAVNKIIGMLEDTVSYLEDYTDGGEIPSNVISYAAYLEKNSSVLTSLIEQVAYVSGGKDHSDDVINLNHIQEILMGGKVGVSQQISVNDIIGV